MEPTSAQILMFNTVNDIFDWAQLRIEAFTALTEALGIEDKERVLASISEADFNEVINNLKVDDKPATPAVKAKVVVARGAGFFAATGKRLGQVPPEAQVAMVAPAKTLNALMKFKFNTVLDGEAGRHA
jgi:hypothetical protein